MTTISQAGVVALDPTAGAGPAGSRVRVAGIVLAAGFSSRMGDLKPLLPLDGATAVERVVSSLRAAGAAPVIVVTGHEAKKVAPVLERLGTMRAHNAGYGSGMFSSVRTGVAALPEGIDAFFVAPVDCPLVTPRALHKLLESFAGSGKGIVYPACFGMRGHPPLVAARYIRPILDSPAGSTLRAVLESFTDDEMEIDVRDLTVLMDMDTPGDYRSLGRFAQALDAAGTSRPEPSLSAEDALFLLAAAGTPANIVRHCRTAAAVGEALATALSGPPTTDAGQRAPALDVALVRSGCLLHDVARTQPQHAPLAAEVLTHLGLPRLGAVVGEHMVIDPSLPRGPGITEAELVYLSDKMVSEEEVVGLDERQARTMRKMRPDAETAERIRGRISEARTIARKVEAILGRTVDEELRGLVIPAEARSPAMRVYLVRHAQADGPEGRRYSGQEDRPLGARGEEQARCLAGRLMTLTGGACFDAVYTSPLARSRRTAGIIVDGCDTPVKAETWLSEIDVGLWEGLTWEEAQERFPAERAAREEDLIGTPFPGGESFAELRERVVTGFDALLQAGLAAGHRRVLVIGHKGVNRAILAHLRGMPLGDIFSIDQDFCAVTLIKVVAGEAGEYKIISVNPR